jgi:hypothetical protein
MDRKTTIIHREQRKCYVIRRHNSLLQIGTSDSSLIKNFLNFILNSDLFLIILMSTLANSLHETGNLTSGCLIVDASSGWSSNYESL